MAYRAKTDTVTQQSQAHRHLKRNPGNQTKSEISRGAMWVVLGSVTLIGVMASRSLPPAFAQTIDSTPIAFQARQFSSAIAITSAEDAVKKFKSENPLYIKGSPLTAAQIDTLQKLLKQNPNIYVVLMDNSTNVVADDRTLSQGIGNSPAFQSVKQAELGERNGVLLMVYFDSNQGRKIFMRAEALPDRLNVGEANFADSSGNPRELLSLFVNAVRNEGKDVPGGLEVVINRINGTIRQHVKETVQGAEQTVQQAQTSLAGFPKTLKAFQDKHSVGGPLGNPDIANWKKQLNQAQTALENRQFNEAKTLSGKVLNQIRDQEQAMTHYGQAPVIAQTVTQRIETAQRDLQTLKDNDRTQEATQLIAQAQQSIEQYQTQYKAGNFSFWPTLQTARQQSEQGVAKIEASQNLSAGEQFIRNILLALGGLATTVTGLFTNRRAARRKTAAARELTEAKAEIDAKTQELMALMDKADYTTLANYTGKTDQMAQTLVDQVTDALTLVGGAEKFVAEAEGLIQGHPVTNTFRTVNFDRAIALLTDPETHLTFGIQDSARAVMARGSSADSWRQTLLSQDTSRVFEKSLQDLLLAMAENRDIATQLWEEITSKDQAIAQYLSQIEHEATALNPQVETLQDQGETDQNFRLEAVADNLLPMVLADIEGGGLIARGRETMHQDPVRTWEDFGDPAQRMTQDAAAIIAVAKQARQTLAPTLTQAHQTLQRHGVETTWAYENQHQLSEELEAIANLAIRTPISEELEQTQQEITTLEDRIKRVVDQDQKRREVCPQLIAATQTEVAQARQDIHDALKQAGSFWQGTAQQILREPEQDPSDRITAAQNNLAQIQPALSQGDDKTAATCLVNIKTLTEDASDLVRTTREALANYPGILRERQQRTGSIHASIDSTYEPTFRFIQSTYAAEVLELVAPEVDAGNTIANNIDLTHNLLNRAQTLTQDAQTQYQQAYLLNASASLEETDRVLQGAQHQLDALTSAKERLEQHQQQAEKNLAALTNAVGQLQNAARAKYVRRATQTLVDQTVQAYSSAEAQVPQKPYQPYLSHTLLTEVDQLREQAIAAIATDQKAFESARSSLNEAEHVIETAEADIHRAARTSFAYASVYTGSAEKTLATAQQSYQQAYAQFSAQAYEDVDRLAQQAVASAQAASQEADSAVRQARRRHEDEIRRQEEAAEAERRRQAAMSSSSFSSDSSSFSSDSGSSGGSWSDDSSGSSGGSW